MTVELAVASTASAAGHSGLSYPDVYFTPGYGVAAAEAENGAWRIAYWQDKIMVPYLLRRIDEQSYDAVSPYGYSGIHVHPDCSAADLARFWTLATDHWRDSGTVTLFLRFSPLDQSSVDAVSGLVGLSTTPRGPTVTVPVDHGVSRVWDAMEGRSRTAIRKAVNGGLEGGIRPADPDDVAAGSPFRQLYERTMHRVGSRPQYLFPDRYYVRLVDGVGKGLLVAEVRDRTGAVVASTLVLRHRDRVHYHLAGSDPQAARAGANNLLLWTILQWAAETGASVVHLGGGLTADDPLYKFKRSFGGHRTTFHTGSAVLAPDRYAALVAGHARELGTTVEEIERSGFFPGYRMEG